MYSGGGSNWAPMLDMNIITPQRGEILNDRPDPNSSDNSRIHFGFADQTRAIASTGVISLSRQSRNTQANAEGNYFVTVSSDTSVSSTPFTYLLTVDVVGEPISPVYRDASGPDGDATTAGTDTNEASDQGGATEGPEESAAESNDGASATDEPAATDQVEASGETGADEGGLSPLVWVLGGIGVLLAAGGAILIGLRSRP
ncbi:hypothetical protein ACQBAT_05285 [Ornithinimicrobium sp. Y1847]|uniref:hypothetical protein n=1 Tax=Ornithinimicrobium sp. Y1847 TaxID=3405419 RepID=UPI003B67672E